jgi:hypothetical protein
MISSGTQSPPEHAEKSAWRLAGTLDVGTHADGPLLQHPDGKLLGFMPGTAAEQPLPPVSPPPPSLGPLDLVPVAVAVPMLVAVPEDVALPPSLRFEPLAAPLVVVPVDAVSLVASALTPLSTPPAVAVALDPQPPATAPRPRRQPVTTMKNGLVCVRMRTSLQDVTSTIHLNDGATRARP